MKWRETSWSEDMPYIKTLISYQIYDHFHYLDDATDDDNDKNRLHVEPLGKKVSERVDYVLHHEKYTT